MNQFNNFTQFFACSANHCMKILRNKQRRYLREFRELHDQIWMSVRMPSTNARLSLSLSVWGFWNSLIASLKTFMRLRICLVMILRPQHLKKQPALVINTASSMEVNCFPSAFLYDSTVLSVVPGKNEFFVFCKI